MLMGAGEEVMIIIAHSLNLAFRSVVHGENVLLA